MKEAGRKLSLHGTPVELSPEPAVHLPCGQERRASSSRSLSACSVQALWQVPAKTLALCSVYVVKQAFVG